MNFIKELTEYYVDGLWNVDRGARAFSRNTYIDNVIPPAEFKYHGAYYKFSDSQLFYMLNINTNKKRK